MDRLLCDARCLDDLLSLEASPDGSVHVLLSYEGTTVITGSLSGLRRVFYREFGTVTVASSNAMILAKLAAAQLDLQLLSSRLLYPGGVFPLESRSMWKEVKALQEDSALKIDLRGEASRYIRWRNPINNLSFSDGAAALCSELQKAVGLRCTSGRHVTSDLSGGMDSAAISFLAASTANTLTTFTVARHVKGDDDLAWAQKAASHMPSARHFTLPVDDAALPFSGIQHAPDLLLDEPFIGVVTSNKMLRSARTLRELGSDIHLSGHGGDEVVLPSEAFVFSREFQSISSWLGRVAEYRGLRRWPMAHIFTQTFFPGSLQAWTDGLSRRLTMPPPEGFPITAWGTREVRLPYWVTAETAELAALALHEVADTLDGIGPSLSTHANIERMKLSGRANRLVIEVMATAGVMVAAPFLDDRVVNSCLKVASSVRSDARRYKPLLAEAMRTIVPHEILCRATKTDFIADAHVGRRLNSRILLELCEDSRLAKLGLVDRALLIDACLDTGPIAPTVALWRTIACEVWLRSIEKFEIGHA